MVYDLLSLLLLNIHAAGYPRRIHRAVVIIAIPIEYTKVLMASGCEKKFEKLASVSLPFSSVKAKTAISNSGITINMAAKIT